MLLKISTFRHSPIQLYSLNPKCKHGGIYFRNEISAVIVNITEPSFANVKRTKLCVRKKEKLKLPHLDDSGGDVPNKTSVYRFSEFLRHPLGMEAMLNTSVLQSFEFLGSNMYRCTLPKVQLLNIEVAPVLDLRVTPTDKDCMVELLSCKFEGSDVVERKNEHFSGITEQNEIETRRNGFKTQLFITRDFIAKILRLKGSAL